jgi:hypothetical protein
MKRARAGGPVKVTLGMALTYIEDDELVEVTPKSIRLCKAPLDSNPRRRAFRVSYRSAAPKTMIPERSAAFQDHGRAFPNNGGRGDAA